MHLFDEKFKKHIGRYILQCLLATVCILVVLVVLRAISNAAIIVALGASTFVVFAAPKRTSSKPRYLIGGYVVGLAVGTAFHWMSQAWPVPEVFFLESFPYIVYGAPAVGLTMFLMVITDTEHPPAASVALGLVLLTEWSYAVLIVSLTGIIVLSVLKWLLRDQLIDLV